MQELKITSRSYPRRHTPRRKPVQIRPIRMRVVWWQCWTSALPGVECLHASDRTPIFDCTQQGCGDRCKRGAAKQPDRECNGDIPGQQYGKPTSLLAWKRLVLNHL